MQKRLHFNPIEKLQQFSLAFRKKEFKISQFRQKHFGPHG